MNSNNRLYQAILLCIGLVIVVAALCVDGILGYIAAKYGVITRTGLATMCVSTAVAGWLIVGMITQFRGRPGRREDINPYASPGTLGHEAPDSPEGSLERRYQECLRNAQRAWTLPSTYFAFVELNGGYPKLWREVEQNGKIDMFNQSPLHWCMDIGHPSTEEDLREKLMSDTEYRWVLRRIFRNIADVAEVEAIARRLQRHGYWQPMSDTILWCLEVGIISDGRKWEPEASPVVIHRVTQ